MARNRQIEDFMRTLVVCGGIEVRDVDGGEDPFEYSSGNLGPTYIDMKGRVSFPDFVTAMGDTLADNVIRSGYIPDIITGNVTGGMIATWEFCKAMRVKTGKKIPFFYVRETRKLGGHKELVTGEKSLIMPGMSASVGEELVNYAGTSSNAAIYLRERHSLVVEHATCFISYDHEGTRSALRKSGLTLHCLFTVDEVLAFGEREELMSSTAVAQTREFLEDPAKWMKKRGLKRIEP